MKKIAVRAPNWLGDCVMCTPFLSRLKKGNPSAELCVVCQPKHVSLFKTNPAVSRVEPVNNFAGCVKRLRTMKFDCGYILPTSFSSALLFYLAGIPKRIGFAAELRSLLLTDSVTLDKRYHYVRRYLSLIGHEDSIDGETPDFFYPIAHLPEFPLLCTKARECFASCKEGLGEVEVLPPLTPPYKGGEFQRIGLGIGTHSTARQWPIERFALLSDKLITELKCDVVLLGGQDETRLVPEFSRVAKYPVVDLVGKTSLEGLGYAVSRCSLVITNESGLMHAAWALNVPSVVIACPSNPSLTSPWGNNYKILWHDEITCVPCIRNECPRKNEGYKECLMKISVDEVFEATRELLSVKNIFGSPSRHSRES